MNDLHLIQFTMEELDLICEALRHSALLRTDDCPRCDELRESIEDWKKRQA